MADKRLLLLPLSAVLLLALALALTGANRKGAYGAELLKNGDFSALAEDGLPASWYAEAYVKTVGFTEYAVIENAAPGGGRAAYIVNHEANDARFAQRVAVEPGGLYCLSGLIKANARGGRGANLSVEGIYVFSQSAYDTDGEWQPFALYGRTGDDQRSLTVFARLGGYSGESAGESWFADVSLRRVAEVPPGAAAVDFFVPAYRDGSDGARFDLRHALLLYFIALYTLLLWRCMRAGSLPGMLALLAGTAALAVLFALQKPPVITEDVSPLSLPLPYVKYVVFALHLTGVLLTLCLARGKARRGEPIGHLGGGAADTRAPGGQPRRMDGRDWALLLLLTALYAALAYTNLGAKTAPSTSFAFSDPSEQVTFDLGEHKADFRMLYMGGIHHGNSSFTVQTSADGETWGGALACEMDAGMLYQWKYVTGGGARDARALEGRYVRLTADNRGLTLLETLFRDAQGQALPVTVTSAYGRDASALVDEPDTLAGEPGWFNSMYFDEIYHARTGYEHLHGLDPMEVSHPPLGKVLISAGIALFGMTPFGWRFAGATCGVMMLPCMYLLGRLLFARRRYALLPCLLLALDTLHFTQTRIATIDSFVVLFILWSVYFMFRWFYVDFFGQRLWRALVPLALSGLFMGLAVASKWPGCFAGVGLAAVFFYGVWRRARAVARARATAPGERDDAARAAADKGARRLLITVASCLVFFVLVPAAVYWCSYIPYFAPSGGVSARRIIDAAESMYGYHAQSGFGMDHPFYSPWYHWPLSQKPMYYAAPRYTPEGYTYAIFAFGNYAVWWAGFLALLLTLYAWCRHQLSPVLCGGYRQKIAPLSPPGEGDDRPALLLLSFAAQFLPWVLVPRGTYIYHYFPSVPFIILCVAYVLDRLNDWRVARAAENAGAERAASAAGRADRRFLLLVALYIALVAAMFIAFYPPASGALVPRAWMDAINWFGNLYY